MVPYRQDNKRRTKHISRSLEPEWHQTLVFPCARREDVSSCRLHVSVWDYDRFKRNDFLGEFTVSLEGNKILYVIISNKRHYCAIVLRTYSRFSLDENLLDNKPRWYRLQAKASQGQGERSRSVAGGERSDIFASLTPPSQVSSPASTSKHNSKVKDKPLAAVPGQVQKVTDEDDGTANNKLSFSPGLGRRKVKADRAEQTPRMCIFIIDQQ